ncbi:membrane protein [Oceanobacillus picturae]|uniref:Membrane protein n=1 Tax=Oceanobacillus picturae TaxID=171693 RepID=A0A0U9HB36_9BACI|nr:membrane protein [Oceanobacillus picturae]
MFKSSMIIAFVFFAVFTFRDLIFSEKVQWLDNIILFVIAFLIYFLWEWSKVPLDWSENKKE